MFQGLGIAAPGALWRCTSGPFMRTKLADANIQEINNFITMDDDLVLNIATEPEIPARKGGSGGKGGRWTERCVT